MTLVQQGNDIHPGAIQRLPRLLESLNSRSLFLVADPQAYALCGAEAALERLLDPQETVVFSEFEPNPQWPDVKRGLDLLKRHPSDVILAVGGGTAIDIAKLIGIFSAQPTSPENLIDQTAAITVPGPPVIAIPTTSGTGSEATHFAVLYVNGIKHSIAHPHILPRFAIIDPALTYSLPAKQTACTGLDAFAQAIESLWSVHATSTSQAYATQAISLVFKHLAAAVHAPCPESRQAMATASHLAGKAINISKTTAPHALSYAITSQFGVPHGLAVALTLGPILVYNSQVTESDVTDPRGVEHVNATMGKIYQLLDSPDAHAAHEQITFLLQAIGCPTRLHEVDITTATQRQSLCSKVNPARLSNNPRALKQSDLLAILESVQ